MRWSIGVFSGNVSYQRQFRCNLIAVDSVLDDAVVNAAEGIEPGIVVLDLVTGFDLGNEIFE